MSSPPSAPSPGSSTSAGPATRDGDGMAEPYATGNQRDDLIPDDDEDEVPRGPAREVADAAGSDDDLFGGSDDEARTADDEDEDDAVQRPRKQRQRVGSASPVASADPANRASLAPSSAARSVSPRKRSASEEEDRDRYAALEHRETSAEPPMGLRAGQRGEEKSHDVVASFSLPSLPVRRGAPHFFARLPNLLQYRAEAFDEKTYDDEVEDEVLQSREGIRIDDKGLRSLLISSNTIRWRRSGQVDEDGIAIRESNARIVRWSDGSQSLQLGSEFYDISVAAERVQGGPAPPSKSAIVPPQPVQHLTHLFVKHVGQDQANVYQAEAPIVGSMMFRPTSITSESHQRLAKAVRQQKGALVKETIVREDPEAEKERIEREQRKAQQKRQREARKRQKALDGEDEDDDEFWANSQARRSDAGLARRGIVYEDEPIGRAGLAAAEEDEEDGFVVDDEDEEGGAPRAAVADMDVDEPDEMDRMEAKMERQQEARRRARESESARPPAETEAEGGATRRRRVVEESDEE